MLLSVSPTIHKLEVVPSSLNPLTLSASYDVYQKPPSTIIIYDHVLLPFLHYKFLDVKTILYVCLPNVNFLGACIKQSFKTHLLNE